MRLWRDHGELLVAELGRLEPPVWQLGGGTLLAKAWRHRLSFDLDIAIPTGRSRRTEQAVLDAIEAELRKRGLDVTYDPAERLLRAKTGVGQEEAAERLAEAGILDHLRYHYRDAGWTVKDVTDRIARQVDGNERLVRIAPAGTPGAAEDQAVFTAQSPLEPPRIGGPRTALNGVHRE